MKGLMLQVEFTGDLEKDRDLLLLGMGGLLVLALSSLLILIFVLLRRRKNRTAAKKLPVTPAEKPLTAESNPQEETNCTEITLGPEKEQPSSLPGQKENAAPETETVRKKAEQKTDVAQEPSPEEKLEEIRRRLEEIRNNPGSGPTPVLRKIEAKKRAVETVIPSASEEENKPVERKEPHEIENTESSSPVELPRAKKETEPESAQKYVDSVPSENPSSEGNKNEDNKGGPSTNKNLPMKKLTFAEWVELFKDPDKVNP
jgi:hypothetical protein